MRLLKESMAWMRKRDDFTDSDIDSFQATADEFIELCIDLNGLEGMSNYLHVLAAGHFSYYLRKYRNLYQYPQQGWEAFNALIKSLYHRHTQKGGYTAGGANQSHLKGVIRFLRWHIKYPGRDPEFYSRGAPAPRATTAQSEPIMMQAMLQTREEGEVRMENSGLHGWELTEDDDSSSISISISISISVGPTAAV
eukprot:scaffold216754_cov54-Attheya_sp.AAC.2